MRRAFVGEHAVKRFYINRFAVLFDRFNNGVDIAADFLLVAVFSDTDTLVVVVGFVDSREARREFGDKRDVRADSCCLSRG